MSSSSVAYTSGVADLSALQPVLETALDAVIVMDAAGLVRDWNARAQKAFGWAREEVIGLPVADLIIPKAQRPAHWAGLKRLAETGEGPILGHRVQLMGMKRDGCEIPIELSVAKWSDGKGRTVFLGFLRDLSETRRADDALRESEERLRVTQEVAQVGIAETDRDGVYVRVNAAFCAMTGFEREELVGRISLYDLTHPDDLPTERDAYCRQVAGQPEPYRVEKRYLRKDGVPVWGDISGSAAYDAEGRFLYGIRVVQDINERKLGEARQTLLLSELNHRVKNILALVRALAVQTGQAVSDVATFNTVFQERIAALAKSHDLLIESHWSGADLRDVLAHELDPYDAREIGSQVLRLDGPVVHLNARAAVSLSLVVHELATNAAKYGALSVVGGTVELGWRWVEDAQPPRLQLKWTERGGPLVRPPAKRGFGSKLIERLTTGDLGGEVRFDYLPEGLEAGLTICPEDPAD